MTDVETGHNILLIGSVTFPQSTYIDINMMPFVIGSPDSVPSEFRHYWPLIETCGIENDERGRIGYLSITESDVPAGRSQRRPGIHTDGHGRGRASWGGSNWGAGLISGSVRRQGLYLANSTEASCRAWDIAIDNPGPMGSCSQTHVAGALPIYLAANALYWMTDNCPHESLPLALGQHRQWMRVVTSRVDLWYAAHSTPNRLGVEPTCRVVQGNKFSNQLG